MPASLMDMFSGKAPLEFSPRDYAGNQIGIGDAIAQNSNSLVGLGMGLLQPTRPGESPYVNALQGYQTGSVADANRGFRTAQLQHQKAQEARQAAQDKLAQSNWERQFSRNDPANLPTEFTRAARDLNLTPGTPEHAQFAKQFYSTKSEGNLAAQAEQRQTVARNLGLDVNDPKVKGWLASGGTLNEKPRDMSVTDITKLSEEGGKLSSLGSFGNTFEPRFAGYKASMLGEAANLAGRNVPGLVSQDVKEGATWWQGYDQYKNTIRHELYGGALTPTEVGVFEKAQINPGMDPEQIKKNLAIQRDVVQNGIKRKANAMIAAGYDPTTIANAYGVNLKDIGVTATGRGGSTPAAPAPPAAPGPGGKGGALDDAREAIKRGAPRDAVLKRLRENGIDPSGL